MTLPIIYISFFILTIGLFFVQIEWTIKYKKWLTIGHLVSLLFLSVDFYLITKYNSSFKTIWVDRLFAISFLLSGAMTFALYRKTLKWWTKIYFGVFFIYPAFAALTFLIDRTFFVIAASPLIVTLLSTEIYYTDKNYDIRTMQGLMAPSRLVLIEKGVLTEEEIGKSDEELIGNGNYKNFKLLISSKDSTIVSVDIDGQQTNLTFRR
jgi:hypothetical protein